MANRLTLKESCNFGCHGSWRTLQRLMSVYNKLLTSRDESATGYKRSSVWIRRMIFRIKAVDECGSLATVATESPREALQSLFAFEHAKFHNVIVSDETGQTLLASDLMEIARAEERTSHLPVNVTR